MRICRLIVASGLLALGGCASEAPSVEAQLAALGPVDFNFHVKPILSRNCFACHGPDAGSREADLRLDVPDGPEGPFALRDSLADELRILVPGRPAESALYHRITSSDPEEQMPPPEAHKTLSPLEIAILERWIADGAEYKPHWAFIPPERPDVPAASSAWGANAIDRFTLAAMERQRLEPSPEADRRTLIRRLSFDLTGLPPTPDEVQAFVEDDTPGAYERLVDRLLATPAFGERMALHWMDLARYADTNGYSIDGGRHMWLWRDWVIRAFNENVPFDRFVTEQLAGDLLPDATDTQRIATGFNRNHMITHEGGTIPEENLTNYVADRVKTTGEVFLGLTMACAQCHDHKYDPISQRDYYRFFAFFNTTSERGLDGDRGINAVPAIEATTPLLDEAEVEAIRQELAALDVRASEEHPGQAAWEDEQRTALARRGQDLALHATEPLKITTPNRGSGAQVLADGDLLIDEGGWMAPYSVSLRLDPARIDGPLTGLRVAFAPDAATGGRLGHGTRDGLRGSFVLTSLNVSRGGLPSDQVDLHSLVPLARATASSAHPDYPVPGVLDDRRHNGWAPADPGRPQHLTVTFAEPVDAAETPFLTVMLAFGQGDNLIAGRFRILGMTGTDDGTDVPPRVVELLSVPVAERTPAQREAVQAYFVASSEATASLRLRRANLHARLDALTRPHPVMVMDTAEEPRPTHILNRGQYDQPLEAVAPGTPDALPPLPALPDSTEPDRLALARWLTSPDHPLLARVTVNRYWQMLFGRGLVATSADFGAQGALPSHPALLDWLAVTFVDSGWDVKAMLKTMVMSATYRQRSAASPEQLERDPQNRWLARGPRFRLQGEFIRDAALKASGLLVERVGGPSVHPYQPPGLWKEVSHYGSTPATAQVFVQDHGEALYRRSLYTYWKRTAPPPAMLTFDAPNREVCTVSRERTNTPLQALVLLNDPQFIEASRHLAQRTLAQSGADDDARLRFAFEALLSRPPDDAELAVLRRRLADERAFYAERPGEAHAYLAVGESPRDPALDAAEHAAWTAVASLIMNLSEAVMRG